MPGAWIPDAFADDPPAGYRSLLAFWFGGASAPGVAEDTFVPLGDDTGRHEDDEMLDIALAIIMSGALEGHA